MTTSPVPSGLNHHHRDTLEAIFAHPTSHNIEWRTVVALLEAIGDVGELREGRIRFEFAGQVAYLERPKHKEISTEQVINLRHILTAAGYAPDAKAGEVKPTES